MLDGTDLGMDFEIRALSARGDIGFDVVSKGNNKFLDFRLSASGVRVDCGINRVFIPII